MQQDILQINYFQYRFFQNIILNEDTVPQIKIFSHFLLKFFRYFYQLVWEQQDQNAYVNFAQVLTETEFLQFIISNKNKHEHYRDLTSFNINYFELIIFEKYERQFAIREQKMNNNLLIKREDMPDTRQTGKETEIHEVHEKKEKAN